MTRFVVKVGGAVAAESVDRILGLREEGHELVVVHGAGPQITEEMNRRGIPVEFVNGRRRTSRAALEVVRESMAEVNAGLCAALGDDRRLRVRRPGRALRRPGAAARLGRRPAPVPAEADPRRDRRRPDPRRRAARGRPAERERRRRRRRARARSRRAAARLPHRRRGALRGRRGARRDRRRPRDAHARRRRVRGRDRARSCAPQRSRPAAASPRRSAARRWSHDERRLALEAPPHVRAARRHVHRRRGLVARRRRRKALPRPLRRHRRRRARPPPPRAARRRARAARPALARLEPLLDRADAEALAEAVGPLRRRAGVLLQLGRRVDRGRAQVGAQGDRPQRGRRARGLVPRPHVRRAVGDRPAGEARRLRAARPRRRVRDARRRSPTTSARRPPRSCSSRCRARAACTRCRRRCSPRRARSPTRTARC